MNGRLRFTKGDKAQKSHEENMTIMRGKIEFALLFLLGFVLGLVLLANDARSQHSTSAKNSAVVSINQGTETFKERGW